MQAQPDGRPDAERQRAGQGPRERGRRAASQPDPLEEQPQHQQSGAEAPRRQRAHDALRQRGVHALDVEPAELPVALVNRYLDIKAAGVL